jgi:soluble lytic murein transglycosylase
MLIARGTPLRVFMGAFAAVLIAAMSITFPTAPAAEGIDEVVTGSIGKAPIPAPLPAALEPPAMPGPASDAFGSALALVTGGNFTDAYDAARALPSAVERRAVQWAAIYYGNGAIPYDTIQKFEADAPDFVTASVFATRIEQSLTKSQAPGNVLIDVLGSAAPKTLDARIALA